MKIRDVATVYAGLHLPGLRLPMVGGHEVRAISVKDIVDSLVVSDDLETVHLDVPGKVDRYMVRAGDVLVACRGTQLKVAVAPPELSGAVLTSTLIGVRLGDGLLPELLFAFLQTSQGQKQLLARVRSGTQQIALTPRDVAEVEVPVPPMDVQARIARVVALAEDQFDAARQASRLRREVAYKLALEALEQSDLVGRAATSSRG